jgi:hypothetical protein
MALITVVNAVGLVVLQGHIRCQRLGLLPRSLRSQRWHISECNIHKSGKISMAKHFSSNHHSVIGNDIAGRRAPWVTPRVIVSDLGDARAQTIIPGGDGSVSSYAYGS